MANHCKPLPSNELETGGGGTTELPNVRFDVQFLGTLGGASSAVSGMNEASDIAGSVNDSQGVGRAARFIVGFGAVDLNVERLAMNLAIDVAFKAGLERQFAETMLNCEAGLEVVTVHAFVALMF